MSRHPSDASQPPAIVPREKLDFDLVNGDIPRHWLGGDAFKTRFFDTMSCFFPEGERFFITSARNFRDQITDPKLLQEVKDFTRQEGQHSMIHRQYNDRLRQQGINVDFIESVVTFVFFKLLPKITTKKFRLDLTSAFEHLTALMVHGFEASKVLEPADRRMRAMYTWHAIEEVEHKAVCYDVMQKIAKTQYLGRTWALIVATLLLPPGTLLGTALMLRKDGIGFFRRMGLMAKGIWWLYKPGGLFAPILKPYLEYFKPGFHPWDSGNMIGYQVWEAEYNRTKDPIAASEAAIASLAGMPRTA